MADSLIGGAVLGDAVSKLSDVIIAVLIKTLYFQSKLDELKETLASMELIFSDMKKLNEKLDRRKEETDVFMNKLKEAEEVVRECENIKRRNWWKRYKYASKLDDLNKCFLKFHLQFQVARNTTEISVDVKGLKKGMEKRRSFGGWSSRVPLLKGEVIGFEDRVKELKKMVLKGECPIVVVSAPGGSGKTTLVTKFCGDPDIQERFGDNIFYATISRTYDIKVIIKNLLERNQDGQLPDFGSDEVAIQQWGSFLGEIESEILLVLDDVWSDFIIMAFKFESPGYKILVTSRTTFTQFNTYQLQPLNHQDATNLFCHSAFFNHEHDGISNDLIDTVVKGCKNHPLALNVIGGSLKRKRVERWQSISNKLSKQNKSVLDLDESILVSLEKSLDQEEPEIEQCYLDLGIFPEDQKIAATLLMDMWVHLYKHDKEGLDTMNILSDISSKNLATLLPIRKHLPAIANHCEEESIVQHDMMRMLAIRLSSQGSVEHRKRLIINPHDKDLRHLPHNVNACILSITTGETFTLISNDVQLPNVEIFVMNFMSKIHPLPLFMQNMERLKVLIITNYGYYFSELENFPAPQHLFGLTTIRLDHVSISSISASLLGLVNLQKLSLIMCKLGNSFNESTTKIPNKLTSLLEINIDSCDDFVTFPTMLCKLVSLIKISITNCHELTSLSEGFGKLVNLEVLRLASCSKLTTLPESMRKLRKLRIVDLSHCLNLCKLPVHIGELGSLHTIDVSGCTGLQELPESVEVIIQLKVFCHEEMSGIWSDFPNVEVEVVKEDTLDTFSKIIPRGYMNIESHEQF